MPRYEILSPDAMATLERGWRRLLSTIGVELLHEEALELLRREGQRVEESTVFLDPEFVLEQIAEAPAEFTLRARDSAKSVILGGRHMTFSQAGGPPFVRVGDERRDGTLEDVTRFVQLSELFDEFDVVCMSCEPLDRPLDPRHRFYRPMIASTENFERWVKKGSKDTAQRAVEQWRSALERYERPALDAAVEKELEEFVARRRTELGD